MADPLLPAKLRIASNSSRFLQGELDSTATRVRELLKENGSLKEQVALLGSSSSPLSSPGAPPPPPAAAPEEQRQMTELRQRVKELEAELEDVQGAADQFQEVRLPLAQGVLRRAFKWH